MRTARSLYGWLALAVLLPPLAAAQVETGGFEFEGVARDYIVFLPQGYHRDARLPVVLNLHGAGSFAQEQMEGFLMNAVADTAGFIVVYPDAVGGVWNSGIGETEAWAERTPDVDDVGFINALIDTLDSRYSIDLDRVYACGFSNGGMMSHRLACQLGDRIAAIASVAGPISEGTAASCGARRPTPALMVNGTKDMLVPFTEPGLSGWLTAEQTADFWAEWNGCSGSETEFLPDLDAEDGSTVEKTTYSPCAGDSRLFFFGVIGGPHNWPGTPVAPPARFAAVMGVTNMDMDATVVMAVRGTPLRRANRSA